MTSSKNHLNERTHKSHKLYQGKSFSFHSDEIVLPDGRKSKRDYVQYPSAAVILPFLDEERILLVEQYRYPIQKTLLELPAGKIDDPNEAWEKAASRELQEETGYSAKRIEYLFSYYPAVGYSTEIIHAYLATDLKAGEQAPDEDEFIDVRVFHLDEMIKLIEKGEIQDAKTILTILHYLQFSK